MAQAAHRTLISFACDRKFKARLQKEAKNRNLSMGHLLTMICVEALDNHDRFNALLSHPTIRKNFMNLALSEEGLEEMLAFVKGQSVFFGDKPENIAKQMTLFEKSDLL